MSENLIIKIGSDVGEAVKGIQEVGEKTDALNEHFGELTLIAAAGFAAFTAEVAISVDKFGEADAASRKLSLALQDQGVYTDALKEAYAGYAEAISAATGFETKDIELGQATIQRYIGEQEVTKELTQAIVDYAAAKGVTTVEAADKLGKAIEGNAGRLKQEGLVIDTTMSSEERYGKVLEFVTLKYGDSAAAANQGLGSLKGLTTAFNSLQELIGAQFAPIFVSLIATMTNFFNYLKSNPVFVDFIVGITVAIGILSGVGVVFAAIATAVGVLTPVVAVLGLTFATALGPILLVVGAVAALSVAIAAIISSHKNAAVAAVDHTAKIKALREEIAKIESESPDLTKLSGFQLQQYTKQRAARLEALKLSLKQEEAAEKDHGVEQIKSKKDLADTIKKQEDITELNIKNQKKKFYEDIKALDLGFDKESDRLRTEAENKKLEKLKNSIKTERDAVFDEKTRKLKIQIDADNKELAETQRYGAAYAAINKVIHSSVLEGTSQGLNELTQLQNSKNEELKAIGKAAAIGQIIIKTGQSAMNIFAGFSEIPIVGEALGIAGAAAAIAYGAEQIGTVTAANQGGLITGGIAGIDSVPALLTPGELVVPERNFDQVVGAVQNEKNRKTQDKPDASQVPQTVVHFHGDTIGDKVYIDKLIRKVNDAVLYRNAQILTRPGGVTG